MKLTFPEALEDDVVGWTLSYTRRGRLYLHEAKTLRELLADAWRHWGHPLRSPHLPEGVKDIYDRETEVADLGHRSQVILPPGGLASDLEVPGGRARR